MNFRIVLLIGFCLLPGLCVGQDKPTTETAVISPNPAIQKEIRDAVLVAHETKGDAKSTELQSTIDEMKSLADEKPSELIQQFVYYFSELEKGISITGDGTSDAMNAAALLHICNFTDEELMQAVLPYLRTSDKDQKEYAMFGMLGTIDSRDTEDWPDFTYFKSFIKSGKATEEELIGLYDYMYRRRLERAVSAMLDVFEADESLRSQIESTRSSISKFRKIRDSNEYDPKLHLDPIIKNLEALLKSPHWYIRLYVAYKIREIPQLRTKDILERLKNDPHPLVHEVIKSIGQPESQTWKTLGEVLPAPVQSLFAWPDAEIFNGPKRISGDAEEMAYPRHQTTSWLHRVVTESWLPENGPQPVFLQDEFDGRDVVRMRWQRHNWDIQVSQTASIFSLKLSPTNGSGTGDTVDERIQKAKDMCLKIFAETGRRWSSQGEVVPVQNLNERIAKYSFDSGKQLVLRDCVWGRGKTRSEMGVPLASSAEESREQQRAENPDWDMSEIAWKYWFRMVAWWNDGTSIGFYFFKEEAGPWLPSYSRNNDRGWFTRRGNRSRLMPGRKAR